MSDAIKGGFEPVPEPEMYDRWEYRIESYTARGPAPDLQLWGLDGWELVAVAPTNMTGELSLWFKRPVRS